MKKYYVARLAGTWPDPLTCLAQRGIASEEARMLVQNAQINGSAQVLVPLNDGKALLLRPVDGGWQEWWAVVGQVFDTPDEANEFLKEMMASTIAKGMEAGTWGIVEFVPNPTMRHLQ